MASINLGPRVAQQPLVLPAPQRAPDNGKGALAAGVAHAGAAVEAVAVDAYQVEARGQASGALAKLQEAINHRVAVMRNTIGEDGVAVGQQLPGQLDEDSAEARKSLRDGLSQALYDEKARDMLVHARGLGDSHVLEQQRVVRAANVDARMSAASNGILTDPDGADGYISGVDDDVRSQSFSKEAAAAASSKWVDDGRKKQIMAYLAYGRLDSAKAAYLAHEKELGASAPGIRDHILAFGLDQQADALARKAVSQHALQNGAVDESAARAAIGEIEDFHLRDKAEKRLEAELKRARSVWDAKLNSLFDHGFARLNQTGTNDGTIIEALNRLIPQSKEAEDGPKLAAALINRENLLHNRNRRSAAEERRAQNELDGRLWYDFLQKPEKERADLIGPSASKIDVEFGGMGASDKLLSRMKARAQEDSSHLDDATAITEEQFEKVVYASIGKMNDKEMLRVRPYVRSEYIGMLAENRGKPLAAQVKKLQEDLAKRVHHVRATNAWESLRSGFTKDTTTDETTVGGYIKEYGEYPPPDEIVEPAATPQAAAPAPPAGKKEARRVFDASVGKWVVSYEDGTFGWAD